MDGDSSGFFGGDAGYSRISLDESGVSMQLERVSHFRGLFLPKVKTMAYSAQQRGGPPSYTRLITLIILTPDQV